MLLDHSKHTFLPPSSTPSFSFYPFICGILGGLAGLRETDREREKKRERKRERGDRERGREDEGEKAI